MRAQDDVHIAALFEGANVAKISDDSSEHTRFLRRHGIGFQHVGPHRPLPNSREMWEATNVHKSWCVSSGPGAQIPRPGKNFQPIDKLFAQKCGPDGSPTFHQQSRTAATGE